MTRKWNDLGPRAQKLIVGAGVTEAVLKIAVLIDVKRRAPEEIRGPKWLWTAGILVNSFGLVPAAYFVFGRRPPGSASE